VQPIRFHRRPRRIAAGDGEGIDPLNRADQVHRQAHRLPEGDVWPQRPHPAMGAYAILVIMALALQRSITPIAWPSSGRISFSIASRHPSGDPGRQNTSRPWYTPDIAPESIAALPIFS